MCQLCRKKIDFFLDDLGIFCQSALAMKQNALLDSYDNAVRTFGLSQSEYEELQEMMEEGADIAVSESISDSDNLGYLSDLLEMYCFECEQNVNELVLTHPSMVQKINIRINNGCFTIRFLGEVISRLNEAPQQTIGHILMIVPTINRDDIYRDAEVYGWGLPEFAGPRVIAFEDEASEE